MVGNDVTRKSDVANEVFVVGEDGQVAAVLTFFFFVTDEEAQ